MGWRKSQLESNNLNRPVLKKKKTIVKVMINSRNSKRTNTKMLKKDLQIIECREGKENKKI